MVEIRRQTAYKLNINQILNSPYVQMQGWEPSYLQLNELKVSRVNVIGVIISKENNLLTIEDGTGNISVRTFQETNKLDELQIGNVVLIIGRPREYSGDKYIVLEIIKDLKNAKWLEFRKNELKHQVFVPPKPEVIQEQPVSSTNNLTLIIDKLRDLDTGDGVDVEKLFSELKIENPDKYLSTLINEGEIYEIRPGKLKLLD